MIKLYIYCSVLIIGNVEVGPDIGMKFHQEVMEIVSYDIMVITISKHVYANIHMCIGVYMFVDVNNNFVVDKFYYI